MAPRFSKLSLAILALAGLNFSAPVFAQSGSSATLEEVVVTARRREESLQDTPLAVSAIGSDMLEQMGISDIEDIETLAPSLQFSQTNYKAPAIFIRGIGQRSGSPGLDPGVGMYLNGVYVPRSDAQLLDAIDVANIQVLRGPQGTLFGKNNIGGAILVDSKKPDPEALEFGVKVAGGSFGRQEVKLDSNVPITDSLAARFAANVKRSDGSIENVTAGNSLFDQDRMAVSSRVMWYATDEVEVDFFGFLSRIDERGSPYNCAFQNNGAILTQGIYRDANGATLEEACDYSSSIASQFQVSQNGEDAVYAIDNHMAALSLRFPLAGFDVESITSFAMQDNIRLSGDSDGTYIHAVQVGPDAGNQVFAGAGLTPPKAQREQMSQELKFNGLAWDDKLNYTFGIFLSQETLDNTLDGTDVGDNGLVAVGPSAAVDLGLPVPIPNALVLPVQANTALLADYTNRTAAIFAQGSWDVREWLQLTVGARYTEEEREAKHMLITPDYEEYANRLNAQIGTNPAILLPVTHVMDGIYSPVTQAQYLAYSAAEVPLVFGEPLRGSTTFSQVTPNLTLNFLATDEMLDTFGLDSFIAYATVSKGFKSGGLDVRNTQTESTLQQFEPEIVLNKEIGFKLDAIDKRLRLNVAVFQMDYTDLQVALYERGATQTEVVQFTGNAGEAVVDGFEFELTALLGDFTVTANASYTDGDFIEYMLGTNTADGFAIVDRSNEAFPQVPQNIRGLVVSYDWDSMFGRIVPQLQYYYSDEIFIGTDYLSGNYDSSTISQYELFNARLNWEFNENMALTAYVNNLKDDHYFVGGIAVTSVIGVANRVPGTPREAGLEFSVKF
ncbi:TonB-dependent receptor [Spongiibacter sp. KMU-158]|uniref:TonB-dependent receptor n=1 Tax=Spongiibacter pelagi TaxID=2760804 RepID=A0A927C4K7_9GAMM|nr:TonB-dependent receptor [Spongiibacter pelagi]MBD2859481.1 TonB-dependent receptor [Spongiibacter pelagi]